jgi:hypothetical protein
MPTMRPPQRADEHGRQGTGDDVWTPGLFGRPCRTAGPASRSLGKLEVRLPDQGRGSHEQGDAQADLHDLLDRLAVAQPAQDQNAGEGRRDGTDHEPLDELKVHGSATEMDEATQGLHHR